MIKTLMKILKIVLLCVLECVFAINYINNPEVVIVSVPVILLLFIATMIKDNSVKKHRECLLLQTIGVIIFVFFSIFTLMKTSFAYSSRTFIYLVIGLAIIYLILCFTVKSNAYSKCLYGSVQVEIDEKFEDSIQNEIKKCDTLQKEIKEKQIVLNKQALLNQNNKTSIQGNYSDVYLIDESAANRNAGTPFNIIKDSFKIASEFLFKNFKVNYFNYYLYIVFNSLLSFTILLNPFAITSSYYTTNQINSHKEFTPTDSYKVIKTFNRYLKHFVMFLFVGIIAIAIIASVSIPFGCIGSIFALNSKVIAILFISIGLLIAGVLIILYEFSLFNINYLYTKVDLSSTEYLERSFKETKGKRLDFFIIILLLSVFIVLPISIIFIIFTLIAVLTGFIGIIGIPAIGVLVLLPYIYLVCKLSVLRLCQRG